MGFIKLPDNLNEWAWYGDNNALIVYIRLRLEAKYKDTDIGNVHLTRGQVLTSRSELAEKCSLTIQQTRTSLERLKSTNKITIKTVPQGSIITLIDYDCDNDDNQQNNQPITSEQPASQPANNQPITSEQPAANQASLLTTDKQISKQQTTRACARGGVLTESFEKFWRAYPKKTAKQQALKAWEKLNPDEELLNVILTSLERQKHSVQWTKDNGQYIPYPATWLNGRRWEDEIQQGNITQGKSSGTSNSGNPFLDMLRELEEKEANEIDVQGNIADNGGT